MNSKKKNFLKNINPKFLELTPKLSIGKDSYVDLDFDKDTLEKGTKELMLRFFKKQESFFKSVSSEESVELSDSKYRDSYNLCLSISERLSLPFFAENGFKLEKPGKKYQDLKKKLEEEMSAKREEEYRKRVIEYNLWKNEQKENDFKETKNLENNELSDNEISDLEVNEDKKEEVAENTVCNENCNCENCNRKIISEEKTSDSVDHMVNNKLSHSNSCSSNKKEEANHSLESKSNVDEGDNSGDECSLILPYQPGGGLMYGGSELTQPDEELPVNLLSPSLKFQIDESQGFKDNSDFSSQYSQGIKGNFCVARQKLFTNSQNSNDIYDLNDALEFCSGKFPNDVNLTIEQDNVYISDELECHENSNTSVDNNECNDKFVENSNNTQMSSENTKILKRVVLLEDSEEEEEKEEEEKESDNNVFEENKALVSPIMVNNDIEENSDEDISFKSKGAKYLLHFSDEEDETSNIVEENDIEEENRSVYYDSEENEIVNPKDFFEKEAELSGSEWSGDEDEKGLDDFEEEDGDAEELDYDQIKSQLEKIHLRHLLDKDSKNIRLLQEFFFEDGDLYSDEKYKKFKWRNLGKENDENFKEDCPNSNIDEIASSDDDDDVENIEVRKERFERQLLLDKMKEQGESVFYDDLFKKIFRKLKVTTIKTGLKNNVSEKKKQSVENDTKSSEKINISSVQAVRGSFLARNDEFLMRLSKIISNINDNIRKPNNSKNFVFAAKSPEKTKIDKSSVSKRTVEDLEDFQPKKKLKTCPKVMEASPFILDLLD